MFETPKPDRRPARTRQAITEAFVELLFTRPYDSITVAEVTERANVGRSSFYAHFKTKFDLLRNGLKVPFSVLARAIDPAQSLEELLAVLVHFKDNQALVRVLLHEPTNLILHQVLAGEIEPQLVAMKGNTILPVNLLAIQIAAAQLALLAPWLLGQIAASPETMADALRQTSRALAAVTRIAQTER